MMNLKWYTALKLGIDREDKMKITKRQLRRIIKEAMNDDFYEFRHQEDQKELEDLRADVVFEIIDQDEGLPGREVVARALRNSVFGGALTTDVHETLDVLVDAGDVVLDTEEDAWYVANSKEHMSMLRRNR